MLARDTPPPAPALRLLHTLGVTGTDVAAFMGVKRHTVIQQLSGRRGAPPELRAALADHLRERDAHAVMRLCVPVRRTLHPATVELRKAGLTHQDLASAMKVDTSAVSYWCAGRSPAPLALAEWLRYRLGAKCAQPILNTMSWQQAAG